MDPEQFSGNTVMLTEDEYKTFVANMVNQILKEECYEVQLKKSPIDSETICEINFKKPPWYQKLDSHAQSVIYKNFEHYILQKVSSMDKMKKNHPR